MCLQEVTDVGRLMQSSISCSELPAVQVAAVSVAGRAYVWACSVGEDGRVSASLAARVDVAGASPSHTCALPLHATTAPPSSYSSQSTKSISLMLRNCSIQRLLVAGDQADCRGLFKPACVSGMWRMQRAACREQGGG